MPQERTPIVERALQWFVLTMNNGTSVDILVGTKTDFTFSVQGIDTSEAGQACYLYLSAAADGSTLDIVMSPDIAVTTAPSSSVTSTSAVFSLFTVSASASQSQSATSSSSRTTTAASTSTLRSTTAANNSTTEHNDTDDHQHISNASIAGIVLGTTAVLVLLVNAILLFRRQKLHYKAVPPDIALRPKSAKEFEHQPVPTYNIDDERRADSLELPSPLPAQYLEGHKRAMSYELEGSSPG
ncbi:hypothetical protein H2198_003286 [Neophaeococcomyces mojaviensis]|uniref:Uncharacterized protein n=1 Tax=Neophaeococcomyces mojaviensis TaxID=3383035 RepID=A0ACC3ABV9_9EURO|nr:hypothetical protein H2198_003286 [Knufia sp. JES_112]